MKKIKNKLVAVATITSPLAIFAQESGGSAPDLSAATTAFQSMSSAVTGWVSTIAPYLASFLAGVLVISLVFVAFKWITRGTKRA